MGNLAHIGATAVVMPATILSDLALVPAGVCCSLPASSRMDRLHAAFAHLRDVIATDFPEFKVLHDTPLEDAGGARPADFFGLAAFRPTPVKPPVIEYDGPGTYEITLTGWEDGYTQIRRLQMAPKWHRFAGQFRFRWPDAPPYKHWTYREKSGFRLIRRAAA